MCGWFATFPFDVVKTRIQGTDWTPNPSTTITKRSHLTGNNVLEGHVNPYRTTISTIVNSYKAEGVAVFYRGLAPTLIRCVNCATDVVLKLDVF